LSAAPAGLISAAPVNAVATAPARIAAEIVDLDMNVSLYFTIIYVKVTKLLIPHFYWNMSKLKI
jgi:hypothetical protein